ncbi:MAG: hypothetical protein ACTHLR_08670 [Rhizomicrobium sp.]
MTRTHDEARAALLRERDARLAAYHAAVAERDALVPFAQRPDAISFDHAELRRAEVRVNSALSAMKFWNDPLPAAPAVATVTAPAALSPPVERAPCAVSPMSEADRLAAQIIASAELAAG